MCVCAQPLRRKGEGGGAAKPRGYEDGDRQSK